MHWLSLIFVSTNESLYSLVFVFANKIIQSLLYIVFTNDIIDSLIFVSTNEIIDSVIFVFTNKIIESLSYLVFSNEMRWFSWDCVQQTKSFFPSYCVDQWKRWIYFLWIVIFPAKIYRNIFRRLHCAGYVSLLVSAAVSLGEFSLLEPGSVINLHMTSLLLSVLFAAATRILVSQD